MLVLVSAGPRAGGLGTALAPRPAAGSHRLPLLSVSHLFLFFFLINYSGFFFVLFCFVLFCFVLFCFSSVVKQWLEGVKVHLCSGKQCPWPAVEIEQIYKSLYQLLCSVLRNWQDCQEEKVSTAAFPAWDGSGDICVGSSVCAQRAESRRVTRGSGLALQRAPNWLCAWGWISLPGSSCISQHCGRDSWG